MQTIVTQTPSQGQITPPSQDAQVVPPIPSQEPPKTLDSVLASINVNQDQLNKLIESGVVVPTPKDIKELPLPLKTQVNEKVAEAERIAKDQLYQSITKQKEDIASLKKLVEDRETAIRTEEEAKIAAIRAEEEKKASLEQKLELLRTQSMDAINRISTVAEAKITELETKLQAEKLSALRKDLITQADVKDFEEFIPGPEVMPNVTAEQIQQYVEIAKQKKESLKQNVIKEMETLRAQQPPLTAGQIMGRPVINQGNANISGATPIDLSKVGQMNRAELKAVQDEVMRKFGFA